MGERYLIVVGDPTTGGGQALEGLFDVSTECLDGSQRNVVCIGHAVLCGQCGMTQVVEGAPLMFVDQPAAYDGCLLACGHKLIATSQRLMSVVLNTTGGTDATVASLSNRLAANGHRQPYDLTFTVTSEETGKPLVGIKYRITLDSGAAVEGTTDEHGLTQTVHSTSPEFATLEVLHGAKPTNSTACGGSDACQC